MPSNAWDEARNAEIAMLFAVIKNEGKANFTTVASQLGEGFTEAGLAAPIPFFFVDPDLRTYTTPTFDQILILRSLHPPPVIKPSSIEALITMPKTWDAAQERLLLMTVISTVDTKPSSEHWAQIAGVIGDGLTASAVSQKFYKLKRESEKLLSGDGAAAAPAPPATPASGTKATDKTPKSSIGKRKGRASADPEADDDNAATATPSKKTKKTTAAKIKKENKKDDEVKTEATDATNGNGVEGTANGAAEGDEVEANKVANKNGI
ncbi:uncharacterized protein HMPREF1541_10997 [Cyphellophora europaea CBS 101466]|uniref:Myb-like domain-containing protein n=1 Tax=Cyphellophora europaea (strain CBS 101466) TaxID=1220924 RepID=W2S5A9_CYPE1|nr:uncharacterized protein HMPREF1541_10997 [Cyphellophora europaea CBS 101466]ETN43866.1 hypothetical protein HMPREF1541_10997 [Cyphellophora europaea CBS 101466]